MANNESDAELYRYMILIHGPEKGFSPQIFETDEYGRGSVSVYGVLEGRVPSIPTDLKHVD